jgi:hypothetical protein
VKNSIEDTWTFVMLCSEHDLHDPSRRRAVLPEDIIKRDAWIHHFWEALLILDGIERIEGAARYGSYRVSLEPSDETNVREVELAAFAVDVQTEVKEWENA